MPKKKDNLEKFDEKKMEEIMQRIGETITDGQIFKILQYYMMANGLKEVNCFIDIYLESGEIGMHGSSKPFTEAEKKAIREALTEMKASESENNDSGDAKGGTLYGRSES